MSPESVAKLLELLQSRRVAASVIGAVVISTVIAAVGVLISRDPLANVIGQAPVLQSAPVIMFSLAVLLAFSYSIALLMLDGAIGLRDVLVRRHAVRRAVKARLQQYEWHAVEYERAETRLRSILRDLPAAYQNVLSQFDTPELRHVTLPPGSGFHSDPVTAALNDMGFIEYVGGLDSKLALYQLKPDAGVSPRSS